DYMQANTGNDTSESKNNFEQNCEDGGSVYLRLSTLPIEQVGKRETSLFKNDVVNGGYWLRKPGPNCEIVIVYQGVIVPEVLQAVGYLSEYRRDIGVMAVTSADRLHRDWRSAINARKHGNSDAKAHIELLLEGLQNHIKFYTVLDGHPATLSWLGGVNGNQTFSLGVDDFGKSGQVCDLYRTFGIDAKSIVELIESTTVGRPRIWAA
ncbi:MAG: transketolase, partial [Rhodobacteraceae bacterium]|nr:transketolase [Paracoccaceae bacterium]